MARAATVRPAPTGAQGLSRRFADGRSEPARLILARARVDDAADVDSRICGGLLALFRWRPNAGSEATMTKSPVGR